MKDDTTKPSMAAPYANRRWHFNTASGPWLRWIVPNMHIMAISFTNVLDSTWRQMR